MPFSARQYYFIFKSIEIVHYRFNCRVFDRDGNGFITRDELQTAMEMMQETVTEHQVNEMLQLADLDKDGKINYEGRSKKDGMQEFFFFLVTEPFREVPNFNLFVCF